MYKIICDGITICDSKNEELAVLDPKVDLNENAAGSFSFKMPSVHPYYNAVNKRTSYLEIYQDDVLLVAGCCIEEEVDFRKNKYIYCEGELSYLNDSIQRPARYQNITVRNYLETLIANHNSQVEAAKQFTVGMVTVIDSNDSLYRYTNWENTLTTIKEDLVDSLGGFVRIRHTDGIRYIDYIADSDHTSSQVIEFGENLLDYASNIDSSEIATAIIPLGAKLDESSIEGLEERLTIKDVNDGEDYVFSQDSVNSYGWIYKTVTWDDVTIAANLKSKGEQYLADIQFENMVLNVSAVDLHLVDSSIEQFKLGDKIRVVSKPHGLDRYFPLAQLQLNLNNPDDCAIVLGRSEKKSLTSKTNSDNETIKKQIEAIKPSEIIQQAVNNATQLINNAMGGYVYKTNSELYIMDTNDPETATKVWRWNINGLGYSSTGINGEYGVAMTMDGAVVASMITAGTMLADRIKGGTLEIGGATGQDGSISVKDAEGNVIGSWDKDGINATKGTFSGVVKSSNAEGLFAEIKDGNLYFGVDDEVKSTMTCNRRSYEWDLAAWKCQVIGFDSDIIYVKNNDDNVWLVGKTENIQVVTGISGVNLTTGSVSYTTKTLNVFHGLIVN